MTPSDSHHSRRPEDVVEAATLPAMGLPRFTDHLPDVPCPLPRRIERVHMSIACPSVLPSPLCRRVGIRDFTFEACSDFTHVTARPVARPPARPLSRGFDPASYPAKPLVSYQTYRQLSGWILPPLVIRAFSGHTA
jgi:hypothetical protein